MTPDLGGGSGSTWIGEGPEPHDPLAKMDDAGLIDRQNEVGWYIGPGRRGFVIRRYPPFAGVYAPSPVFAAAMAWGESTTIIRAMRRWRDSWREYHKDRLWFGSDEADRRYALRLDGREPEAVRDELEAMRQRPAGAL